MNRSAMIQEIAQELKIAQDQCQQLEPFSSRYENFGIEDAYLVADIIHKMRIKSGASPIGRKIGFTNPAVCSHYGVREPMWGYMYDSTVFYHSSSNKIYNLETCTEPLIEPEIIVHFHSSPPLGADPAQILNCIDWIAHGFEIVQSHYPQWKFQAADTIADCGLHAMLIFGEPVELERLGTQILTDLENFTISLLCNDDERDHGRGSNVLGNPINAIMHLLEILSKQPHAPQLQADELVTTGSLTAALPVASGQQWSTRLSGITLPGISVTFGV